MGVRDYIRPAEQLMKNNSSEILTALTVVGTISTAYLSGRASYKAALKIAEYPAYNDKKEEFKANVKLVWKDYIPAVASGVATIACIFGGAKLNAKKTAAAYSLLAVSERAFDEYKEKIVEQIGPRKEQAVRDSIAQDRVSANAPLVISGAGNILCFESHTGRYFNCDMETLRKAENTINSKMIRENEASLSDFYYLVGLPYTSYSSATGWSSDKMLELRFSTVLSEDNRPCISFEYNYVKPL